MREIREMLSVIELNEMSKNAYPHTLKKGDLIKSVWGYEEVLEVEVRTWESTSPITGRVGKCAETTIKTDGKIPVQKYPLAKTVIVVRAKDLEEKAQELLQKDIIEIPEETVEPVVEATEPTAEVVAPVDALDIETVLILNDTINFAKSKGFEGGFEPLDKDNPNEINVRYFINDEPVDEPVKCKIYMYNKFTEDEIVVKITETNKFICCFYYIPFECIKKVYTKPYDITRFLRSVL